MRWLCLLTPRLKVYEEKHDRVLFEQDIIAPEDKPITVTFHAHFQKGRPSIHVYNDVPGPPNTPRSGRHGNVPFISTKIGRIPWQMKLTDEQGQPRYPFLIMDSISWKGPIIEDREKQLRADYMPRRRCSRIEDEFSFHARQQQLWKIDAVDLATMKLTATLHAEVKPTGPPKTFDLLSNTRVMKGVAFADLKALQPGQTVLFDLTWVTLYGPGRITNIWLDEPARALATAHQLARHRIHTRERGLPGWVTAVEDEPQFVTVTFFSNVEPSLFDELTLIDPKAPPPKDGTPLATEPRGGLAVARESLMTYDPVNDRKQGSILEVKKITTEPGSGGVQIKLKMDMILEGYRPRRIVRFFPSSWKVNALPREEEFFGRE